MASKTVVDAVAARLGEVWNGLPVILPNTAAETPDDGSAFLTVQFPIANVERKAINQRVYREEGGFRLVISAARGDGLNAILALAEQLGELFRDQKFGGVATLAPSAPFFDDSNESGNYFKAAVVVPYTFNF